jgi:uncharacterized protein YggT (Ycf19 family)
MTYERRTVRRTDENPTDVPPASVVRTDEVVERTAVAPSGGELLRRLVVLLFGIVQVLIVLRIVLLLLNAREGNTIVQLIMDGSQPFVAPFIGIFNTNALQMSGSVLDIAAIAALVGWTVIEMVVLWAVNVTRREPV